VEMESVKYLTIQSVSEMLCISESALYKWIKSRRIPYVDLGEHGRRRCIRITEPTKSHQLSELSEQNRNKFKNPIT